MKIIDKVIDRVKGSKKRIVLPEVMDERVMKAASYILDNKICDIVIIGSKEELAYSDDILLKKAIFVDRSNSSLTENLTTFLYKLRKDKGLTYEDAEKLILNDNMYFATMLVKLGYADGVVSGACHSSADTIKPALQIIKSGTDNSLVSAFFLVEVPNCSYGEDGVFVFADAGLNRNPSSEELANICYQAANSFSLLTGKTPKVAFLSHSTRGSSKHEDVDKVVKAFDIAKDKYPSIIMDGEVQLDAAIVPEVAKIKCPDSPLKGEANVLIFPDLDAANIGYKLVERLGGARAYGPICQGLSRPVNDLSRGCSVEDIVGVIAITVLQTLKK